MSATHRNARFGPSQRFPDGETAAAVPLAPDIFTDRNRPAVVPAPAAGAAAPLAAPPAAPPPTLERPSASGTPGAAPRGSLRDAPAADSILEARHPDIVRAISLLWGFPEMNQYFDRLWLADDTHGPIDPDAMSELMLLARVHQMIVPPSPRRSLAAIYGSNRMFDPVTLAHDPWRDVPPRR
jgi:hypothetical protein